MQEQNISGLIFSTTLRALIDSRHLTQVELAEQTGVSQGAVSGWLNESIPRAEVLYRIAKALGVSMEYLITGSGEPTKWAMAEDAPDNAEARRLATELLGMAKKLDQVLKKY